LYPIYLLMYGPLVWTLNRASPGTTSQRTLACELRTPWLRTMCSRGGGTSAQTRAMSSSGSRGSADVLAWAGLYPIYRQLAQTLSLRMTPPDPGPMTFAIELSGTPTVAPCS